jgi:hypothetical protein
MPTFRTWTEIPKTSSRYMDDRLSIAAPPANRRNPSDIPCRGKGSISEWRSQRLERRLLLRGSCNPATFFLLLLRVIFYCIKNPITNDIANAVNKIIVNIVSTDDITTP